MPDLLTGWTLLACGLLARARRPRSSTGALLSAAGFAWFAGNFAFARWVPLAWVASHLAYVHRGVLLHAALSFATGRLPSWALTVLVVVGYAVALVPAAASNAR